jgi:hypothetical protein
VPLVAELFARRDRHARALADRLIREHAFTADEILAEAPTQRLEERREVYAAAGSASVRMI